MTASRLAQRILGVWLLIAAGGACAQSQDEPPPPEEVFLYTAHADAERVYLDFDVRDGFYAYRSRFGFGSNTPGVALGAARFPRGETHTDEFFGEQEVFRREFEVAIPYRRSAPAETTSSQRETMMWRPFGSARLGTNSPWYLRAGMPASVPDEYPPRPFVISHSRPRR